MATAAMDPMLRGMVHQTRVRKQCRRHYHLLLTYYLDVLYCHLYTFTAR